MSTDYSNDSPTDPSADKSLLPRQLTHRRQTLLLGGAVTVIGGLILSASLWTRLAAHETEPVTDSTPEFKLTPAQMAGLGVARVQSMAFRTEIHAEGKITFSGDAFTPIFAPYSGKAIRLFAAPGDVVARGKPLASFDSSEFSQAVSDWRTARAQLTLATAISQRKEAAYHAEGASLQEWQQAQTDQVTAQGALNAALAHLHAFGLSDTRLQQLLSQPDTEPETLLTAPVTGVVVDRQLGPGQFVYAGGSSPLFTMADLSTVWLIAHVREADANQLRAGLPIDVHVLALPGKTWHTTIQSVGASIDPVTRRIEVRASLTNPEGELKPEMFASFNIIGRNGDNQPAQSPAVPESAVIHEADTARVWVIHDNNQLELRNIKLGRRKDNQLEVLDGVTTGERIVTSGSLFIDRAARPN